MFEHWGAWMYRRRGLVLTLSALLFAASLAAVVRGGRLGTGTVSGTESTRGREVLERELGRPVGSSFTVVFEHPGWSVNDQGFRDALTRAVAPLRVDPRVASVRTPYDLPPPANAELIATDGHAALATVELREGLRDAAHSYPALRALVHPGPLAATFTGPLAFNDDLDRQLETDLRRAEIYSIPLALLFLVLVFGSLVASTTPLLVGGLSVLGGVAGVMLLSHFTDVAQYALNIVSLVGLGVAIDYSLFIVKRHQEELAAGASVEEALRRAIATAGHAVAFSGIAVAIGLSGLLFYRGSFLTSVGLAGAIVVGFAVLYALTFLPALLGVLGHNVNRGRLPRWGRKNTPAGVAGGGAWHRIAGWVMARPVTVLIPTLAVVLLMGAPFLRLQLAGADVSTLPASAESRRGHEELARRFPASAREQVVLVARFPTAPALTPTRAASLYDLSRAVGQIPGVDAVQSVVNLDPRMGREQYAAMAAAPPSMLPPMLQAALREGVGPHAVVLVARARPGATRSELESIVRAARGFGTVADGEVLVTGRTAIDLDMRAFIKARTPMALGFVMAVTCLVLFALLRSVLLPIKAVLMNLLSISGSFGALVWIFQEGHFGRVLGITPAPIDPSLPVILFCTVFGLSMDYEVILLSRMREEYLRTGDNTHSVAEGLERSGKLVTSAAAIMVAVFVAFATARVVLIQAIGLGMAVAIALDATIVRILMVPAAMRLFGDLNWWMPSARTPLRGLIQQDESAPAVDSRN